MDMNSLSPLANALVNALLYAENESHSRKITVNSLVSKVATWYEKLRNAMDYREEEVVLRAAIERILKRRILLGGVGKTISEPLVRELVWARYFPNSLSESVIEKISEKIDLYLELRGELLKKDILSENTVSEWIYHLASSDIVHVVHPNKEKEIISNFMFQIIRKSVVITDDTDQTKDAQVFVAVRRSFAKDDLAFLRYHLFNQFFGELQKDNLQKIADSFMEGYKEIHYQINYPRKDRIYAYVNSKTAVFLILEDLLLMYGANITQLVKNGDEFKKAVFSACEARYSGIADKVKRAIVRSVIFIILTKVFFAFSVEGSVESLLYGKILWKSILVNTTIPPLLMICAGFFLKPPGKENSERIFNYIKTVLQEENPRIGNSLEIKKTLDKSRPIQNAVFTLLWILAFILTFGIVIFILTALQFHPISQLIFLFFLTIVSFLSYRIGLMSRVYTVDEKPGILAPVIDFFLMPIIRVGSHLTEGISQISIILFVFDFIIETPFKGLFSFFEQWFFFLHTKREELG